MPPFPRSSRVGGEDFTAFGAGAGGCSLPACLGFQTLSCAQGGVGAAQTFSTPSCPAEKGHQSEVPPSCIWQPSLCKAILALRAHSQCQRL